MVRIALFRFIKKIHIRVLGTPWPQTPFFSGVSTARHRLRLSSDRFGFGRAEVWRGSSLFAETLSAILPVAPLHWSWGHSPGGGVLLQLHEGGLSRDVNAGRDAGRRVPAVHVLGRVRGVGGVHARLGGAGRPLVGAP